MSNDDSKGFVKLTRVTRKDNPEIFDIEPYSLCKLVDALSGGNVLTHIDHAILFNHFGIGINNTLIRFAKHLLKRLDDKNRQAVFGKVRLQSVDDFKSYFAKAGKLYHKEYAEAEVKRYMTEKFDFDGKAFTRKEESKYINI